MTRPLQSVKIHHGTGFGDPADPESHAPGYCWCGRWAKECEGLAAVRRGEEPPPMERVIWDPVEF